MTVEIDRSTEITDNFIIYIVPEEKKRMKVVIYHYVQGRYRGWRDEEVRGNNPWVE